MKKELLEIKRTLTIDRYNITRITGYIVDNDRNCRLEFVKNFLNLEETETFKYLDIFKKVLSGKPGRNMFQLDFEGKTRKQHLATIVKTGLEDNDVRQIFLEEIAESIDISNKGYSLILIASGIYDIPGIATDGADLDESEEVYEYMIGCICPVSLSAAGARDCRKMKATYWYHLKTPQCQISQGTKKMAGVVHSIREMMKNHIQVTEYL